MTKLYLKSNWHHDNSIIEAGKSVNVEDGDLVSLLIESGTALVVKEDNQELPTIAPTPSILSGSNVDDPSTHNPTQEEIAAELQAAGVEPTPTLETPSES